MDGVDMARRGMTEREFLEVLHTYLGCLNHRCEPEIWKTCEGCQYKHDMDEVAAALAVFLPMIDEEVMTNETN